MVNPNNHNPHPLVSLSWATWRATAERYGLSLDLPTFLAYAGTPARGILNDLCSKQGVTLDVEEVLTWKHSHYLEHHVHTVKPIDPVVAILRAAKAQGMFCRVSCAPPCLHTPDAPFTHTLYTPHTMHRTARSHCKWRRPLPRCQRPAAHRPFVRV